MAESPPTDELARAHNLLRLVLRCRNGINCCCIGREHPFGLHNQHLLVAVRQIGYLRLWAFFVVIHDNFSTNLLWWLGRHIPLWTKSNQHNVSVVHSLHEGMAVLIQPLPSSKLSVCKTVRVHCPKPACIGPRCTGHSALKTAFRIPTHRGTKTLCNCHLPVSSTRHPNKYALSLDPELECISSISESNQYSVRNWYMYIWSHSQALSAHTTPLTDTETCHKQAVALCKSACMRGLVHLSDWQFIKIVHGSECNL